MNVNYVGLLAVVVGLVAFKLCVSRMSERGWKQCLLLGMGFAILSVPALLFAAYYLHVLPEWAWFYTLRSWHGSEFFVVFLASAAGCMAALLPRKLLMLPLLGFLGVAAVPYLKPLFAPLQASEIKDQWKGSACLQSTGSTCGPASVSTILKHYGAEASEREAARAAYTTSTGTEAWFLSRYVKSKGFTSRFDFRETFTPEVGLPAVVGVRMGSYGHFIAVLSCADGVVTFADPIRGEEKMTLSKFRERYTFTGFHMPIGKG